MVVEMATRRQRFEARRKAGKVVVPVEVELDDVEDLAMTGRVTLDDLFRRDGETLVAPDRPAIGTAIAELFRDVLTAYRRGRMGKGA